MNDFGLLVAQYNSTLPTLTDGNYTELQVDVNGRLLVQADVTVLIDFLGLNGAADSANILVSGSTNPAAPASANGVAIKVNSSGHVAIFDDGNSITVDAVDLDIRDLTHVSDSVKVGDGTDFLAVNADGSINITDNGGSLTVDAIDLDIRDLSASQDNVAISDGTDTLAVNTDGSINVKSTSAPEGTEAFASADDVGDGIVAITTTYSSVASVAMTGSGTIHIYGFQFDADSNAEARLLVYNTLTASIVKVLKVKLNSSSMPGVSEFYPAEARIEEARGADLELRLEVKVRTGANGNASGSIHARLV